MKSKKTFSVILLLIMIFTFSGCWDDTNIEKKVFVSTIGIDPGSDIEKADMDLSSGDNDKLNRLRITYGFPNISEFSPSKAVIKEDGTITVEESSMGRAVLMGSSRSSRDIYLGHTRLILINQDMFKYPRIVRESVDYIKRNPNINRKSNLVITEGKCEDFMKEEFQMDKHIESYVNSIMDSDANESMIARSSLNEFFSNMSQGEEALIPILGIDDKSQEISLKGAYIIYDYEIQGRLSPDEIATLKILNGSIKSGVKSVIINGYPYDYEITGCKRMLKSSPKDNEVIDVTLKINGNIEEGVISNGNENLKSVENEINECIANECQDLVNMSQSEVGRDFIGIGEGLKLYYPDYWNRVKENWQEEFKRCSIRVFVDSNISSTGALK